MSLNRTLFLCTLLFLSAPLAADEAWQEIDYPKEISIEGSTLKVHHPVINKWENFEFVEGWIPVEVTMAGSSRQWLGSVRARAKTQVDAANRLVELSGQQVLEVKFTDESVPQAVRDIASSAVATHKQTLMLDEILQVLAEDAVMPQQGSQDWTFNTQPPRIVVSEQPMQLMLIDQQPVKAPINDTSLEIVVNTDWPLFYDTESRSWYVINQGTWQSQSMLATGGWTTTDQLPKGFEWFALGDDRPKVRDAYPAKLPATEPPPFLVSLEPTELIITRGKPVLMPIKGAGNLQSVSNTDSDLFALGSDWFYLAAGRWFRTDDLQGRWTLVSDLPPEFSAIPVDHAKAHVRASVPGTLESLVAMVEAIMPYVVEVPASTKPSENVVYVGQPLFEPIQNTRIQRAVNTPYAVLLHNNFYYLCYEGAWYFSADPDGPWQVALSVPEEIYSIPPSDPLHYVTYVRVDSDYGREEDKVRFTYNKGYLGEYSTGLTVVQGTGWQYSPWVGYPMGYPVFWGYPYTYGWNTGGPGFYNRNFYHYGGYWGSQTIKLAGPPHTVPGGAEPEQARQSQGYTTLDEQRQAEYNQAFNAQDDLYADASGDVFRRSEEGWSQHNGSGWDTMAEMERRYGTPSTGPSVSLPEAQQPQAYKQDAEDAERLERYYERRQRSYNMYGNIYVR